MRVGAFEIGPDKISGPKDYLESESFKKCQRRMEDGTHPLIGMFPPGTNLYSMIGVIVQTDYASWKGAQGLLVLTHKEEQ